MLKLSFLLQIFALSGCSNSRTFNRGRANRMPATRTCVLSFRNYEPQNVYYHYHGGSNRLWSKPACNRPRVKKGKLCHRQNRTRSSGRKRLGSSSRSPCNLKPVHNRIAEPAVPFHPLSRSIQICPFKNGTSMVLRKAFRVCSTFGIESESVSCALNSPFRTWGALQGPVISRCVLSTACRVDIWNRLEPILLHFY
jgi:hypothetical protein